GVEEGRLEDCGREDHLVERRVVVRIDGLRCHAPLATIRRLTDAGLFAPPLESYRAYLVAESITGANVEGGVVAPFVRIADLGMEGRELFERDFLGRRAHPGKLLDVVRVGSP